MMELLGKSKEELRAMCESLGEPGYRSGQIYHALYVERKFGFEQMTNLPATLRQLLSNKARITLPTVKQRFVSADGSVRYLFGLGDAEKDKEIKIEDRETPESEVERGTASAARLQRGASVEAVFMPSEERQTICISTQAGCAVDCKFCLTAQLGLIRNLTAGEILAQVLVPLEEHQAEIEPRFEAQGKQTNIVLMGQGEPLLNFEAVMAAVRILLDPQGMGISPKHVTLSTSGIVPGIERLGRESVRPKLAISLNASSDEQRDRLMPINKKYPLAALIASCRNYPLRNWEHLTFEYVMLGGVNDSAEDARRVAKLLAPVKSAKVNLIPWNPGELPYHESSAERIEAFRKLLIERELPTFVRYSRGRDVMAACGQLAWSEVQAGTLRIMS